MEEIKDLVSQALEAKRVLSKLKAQLRAEVFIAIDEQEKKNGKQGLAQKTENPKRASLCSNSTGMLLVGLVREFLEWSGMEFTLKVFEPEMLPDGDRESRIDLAKKLGVTMEQDAPLLLSLLKAQEHRSTESKSAPEPVVMKASLAPVPAITPVVPKINMSASSTNEEPMLAPRGAPPPRPGLAPLAPVKTSLQEPEPALAFPAQPAVSRSTASQPTPAPAKPASAPPPPAASVGDHSYADDVDVDIDDDLEGAEIMDDDEDYASMLAQNKPTPDSEPAPVTKAPPALPQNPPLPGVKGFRDPTPAPAVKASVPSIDNDRDDYEDSGLSATYIPGRLRPLKHLPGHSSSSLQDTQDVGGLTHSAGDRSLDLMTGDRSFGASHELGGGVSTGLTSHPVGRTSQSGDISYSEDMSAQGSRDVSSQPSPTEQHKSMSGGLSADFPCPSKLEALPTPAPLGGLKPPLPKLGALAPLGKPGALPPPASLTPLAPAGGLAPRGAPAPLGGGPGARKNPEDIKAELRKAGLIHSGEDLGVTAASKSKSGSVSVGGDSLDLPDNTHDTDDNNNNTAAHKVQSVSSQPAGRPAAGPLPGLHGGPPIRPVHGGVYDAEVSVITSADQSMEMQADIVEEDTLRSSLDSEAGLGRSGLGVSGMYHPSKGLSMDMRDTGLSTSDKSGDLDKVFANADFAETAEWQ